MDSKTPRPMTPFDNLVTPSQIYTLKLMLPYTPLSMQRMTGLLVKFLELQYTYKYFYGFGKTETDSSELLHTIKDYMSPEEQEMMEQMEMMMNMIEMMQDMPDMSDMTDGFPDIFASMFQTPDAGKEKGENDNE